MLKMYFLLPIKKPDKEHQDVILKYKQKNDYKTHLKMKVGDILKTGSLKKGPISSDSKVDVLTGTNDPVETKTTGFIPSGYSFVFSRFHFKDNVSSILYNSYHGFVGSESPSKVIGEAIIPFTDDNPKK